jgi:hypothetical protein
VSALLSALARLFLLQILDLGKNELGSPGVQALAPTLARFAALQKIFLEENRICSGKVSGAGSAIVSAALGPCLHKTCDQAPKSKRARKRN